MLFKRFMFIFIISLMSCDNIVIGEGEAIKPTHQNRERVIITSPDNNQYIINGNPLSLEELVQYLQEHTTSHDRIVFNFKYDVTSSTVQAISDSLNKVGMQNIAYITPKNKKSVDGQ